MTMHTARHVLAILEALFREAAPADAQAKRLEQEHVTGRHVGAPAPGCWRCGGPMDAFVQDYLSMALWSTTDDDGKRLDTQYGVDDFAPQAVQQATIECRDFQKQAGSLLDGLDEAQVAQDFWLTRNRHGVGHWARGYPGQVGQKLTDIAHSYGSSDIYAGDDGRLYLT